MSENITPENYRAQISMLNHEIYELEKKLEQKEQERIAAASPDKYDPFDNPTEYSGFGGNYAKVLPELDSPECSIPFEPGYQERKRLRKYYSIGGACILLQFLLTTSGVNVLLSLIFYLIGAGSPAANSPVIFEYVRSSSILTGVNMLIYLIFDVIFTFLGLKWAKFKPSVLVRTSDFSFVTAVQYCLAGFLIWYVAFNIATGVGIAFGRFGINTYVSGGDTAKTPIGFVVTIFYTLIIAPIAEEMLMRGMFLRVVSRANQRFAVFASATLFGLIHGNIKQFIIGFAVGVFLAHITLKHGSIVPSVIVHIFINAVSLVFNFIAGSGTQVQFVATMLIIAASIVGLIMLLIFRSAGDRLPTPTPKQSRRGAAVACSSLLFCLAYAVPFMYMLYLLYMNN